MHAVQATAPACVMDALTETPFLFVILVSQYFFKLVLDAVLVAVGFDSVTGVTRDLGKRHDFTVSVAQLVRMLENSFFFFVADKMKK